jgi:hypothetical protein
METDPKAMPRVKVNHVAPRPTKAATVKANNDPKSNRTFDPIKYEAMSDDDRNT